MPTSPSRRTVLRRGLAGIGLAVGFAGCAGLGGEEPPALTLRFLNYTDHHRLVEFLLFRDDRTAYQDAKAF